MASPARRSYSSAFPIGDYVNNKRRAINSLKRPIYYDDGRMACRSSPLPVPRVMGESETNSFSPLHAARFACVYARRSGHEGQTSAAA
jgi:hypothetical protein